MLSPKLYDVIINGGGPVGVGLAIELGQRGHRVAVVEKHLQPQPIPLFLILTHLSFDPFIAFSFESELLSSYVFPDVSVFVCLTFYVSLLSGFTYDFLLLSPFFLFLFGCFSGPVVFYVFCEFLCKELHKP